MSTCLDILTLKQLTLILHHIHRTSMISGDDIILLFNVFNSNSAVDALHLYQYYIIGAFLAKPMMKR